MFPRLLERRKQAAGSLSGGEQQMLAIARALMLSPRLLLLDEPSLGLAPLIVRDLFETLGQINRDFGTTMVVVEQNANLAFKIAQQAFVLETGEIVAGGDAKTVESDDSVRKAYLGY
jgi:branched-chain amino acid transport system ATP-binding protein